MNKKLYVFIAVLIIANAVLYMTPFVQCQDGANFNTAFYYNKRDIHNWKMLKDLGPTEVEIKGLPESDISRRVYQDKAGNDVEITMVVSDLKSSLHPPTDCLPAQGWIIEEMKVDNIYLGGETVPVNVIVTHIPTKDKGVQRELIWYWYPIYHNNFSKHYKGVLYNSAYRVMYGKKFKWAMVRLSTHIVTSVDDSMKAMTEFFKDMYPIIKHMKDTEG
ncbi:MAG: EpsI family protein [Candidatus Ancaeobacter aquaticus]|nr:EpsI family protein [Candidatus Ancaeobacter aquaticus]